MPTFTKEQYEELEKMGCMHQLSEEETRVLADEINRDIMKCWNYCKNFKGMTVEIQEKKKIDCRSKLEYIKQWPNVPTSLVPQKGDVIKVHFGDFGENVNEYIVLYRIIDGDGMNKIIVVVKEKS